MSDGATKIAQIFPADNFKSVCDNAGKEIEFGIIIGWDKDLGELTVFGGGTDDGRRPASKDWLWLVEVFKARLLAGDYNEG